jgi:hypothetical protein
MTEATGRHWLWSCLCEKNSDGSPMGASWGRVASSVCIIISIGLAIAFYIAHRALPEFSGLTTFSLAPYAANKVTNAVSSFSNQSGAGQ